MFKKIYLMYTFVTLASIIVISFALGQVLENYFIDDKEGQLMQHAQKISRQYSLAYSMGIYDKEKLSYDFRVLKQHLGANIWFIDTNGNVYVDYKKSKFYSGYEIQKEDVNKILNGKVLRMRNKYFSDIGAAVVSIGYPIISEGEVIGGLILLSSIPEVQKTSSRITKIAVFMLIIMMGIMSVVAYVFSRKITNPLKIMEAQAIKYAKGDFSEKIDLKTNDEIEDLANSLNTMASELEKVEENRDIFLSNISHDIKTPLTNINGFVEAMKDGTIPKDNYDKYINIISKETKRLITLTQDIINMNDLFDDNITLKIERIEINQIIRNTINAFEEKIKRKNIQVHLTLAENESYVMSDKDKIERVLYNLIDNSIKFCRENKNIYIETTLISNKVEINILDEGIGISKENISDIWKRFYKVDKSRGQDKMSFGLGLYIVKQIIDAHEQEIMVESVEGEWTKFSFTLSRI